MSTRPVDLADALGFIAEALAIAAPNPSQVQAMRAAVIGFRDDAVREALHEWLRSYVPRNGYRNLPTPGEIVNLAQPIARRLVLEDNAALNVADKNRCPNNCTGGWVEVADGSVRSCSIHGPSAMRR
jgi:hypothetical protein